MDYKKYLLSCLLKRYEGSQAFKEMNYNRRVLLQLHEDSQLNEILENSDEKQAFLRVLHELQEEAVIEYSWMKYGDKVLR